MGYYDIVKKKSCTLPTVRKKIRINSIITLVRFLTFENNLILLIFYVSSLFSFFSGIKITNLCSAESIRGRSLFHELAKSAYIKTTHILNVRLLLVYFLK